MVEKRTFVFLALATIVWAASASAFAGYYYLQNRNYAEQLDSTQGSLNKVASSYNEAITKYDQLLSDYAPLRGNYSFPLGVNFTHLMSPLENLIANLGKNYTNLFAQEDLNKTYVQLLTNFQTQEGGNVTRDRFGELLNEYYSLFNLVALRELGRSVSEAATLSVNILIDYGNGTREWHNGTSVSAGYTLFKLTQEIAVIDYKYYAELEPGHIMIDSINGKAKYSNYTNPLFYWGYSWIWFYWDTNQNKWISGPVGCDAWLLKDGGVYKWNYEYWHFP